MVGLGVSFDEFAFAQCRTGADERKVVSGGRRNEIVVGCLFVCSVPTLSLVLRVALFDGGGVGLGDDGRFRRGDLI